MFLYDWDLSMCDNMLKKVLLADIKYTIIEFCRLVSEQFSGSLLHFSQTVLVQLWQQTQHGLTDVAL